MPPIHRWSPPSARRCETRIFWPSLDPLQSLLNGLELELDDIDLIELNEAFAAQSLACIKDLGLDTDKVNVYGGGIALGHPLGASGAKLMTTLLHEMERRGARYGLQTMCEGGGMANATLLERLG